MHYSSKISCVFYIIKRIAVVFHNCKKAPNLQIMCLKNKKWVFKTWITTGFSLFLQLPGKNGMAVEHLAMKRVPHSMLKTITFSLSLLLWYPFYKTRGVYSFSTEGSLKQQIQCGKQSIGIARQGTEL